MQNITRRDFLKASGAVTGAIILSKPALALDYFATVADPLGAYPYRGWEELYRNLYTYDYVSRSTHSMNCTGSCTWKVYVKNGIAFKEEQYADYPEDAIPTCPTYNPRGCQKGGNYIEYVYGPQRLKYPLIRTGERGQGKWRRATWTEVNNLIASKIVNTITNYGADAVTFYSAIPAKHQITFAGGARLANLIGGVMCSFYDWYCDLPPGEPITWGEQTDSCEAADWFNSKYLILWGSNLLETRIPDAHFMTEARMRGAKIVAIFPEYNPVSIHADEYIAIKPGQDSALAMGMAKVIVEANLHDAPYLTQFTDMPMLVRTDNGKLLRKSDMVLDPADANADKKFYVWDLTTAGPALAPGVMGIPRTDPLWTLNLGSITPELDGTHTVTDKDGLTVGVTTVFTELKANLAAINLTTIATETGVPANVITRIATEFANTKPARIIEGAGVNHYYHNDLNNRTEILLVALTGNVGKKGGGFDHYVGQEKIWPEGGWFKLSYPNTGTITSPVPPTETIKPAPVEIARAQRFQNTTIWTYMHADMISDVDGILPRPLNSYITDSVNNGWMPLYPKGSIDQNGNKTGKSPKFLIIWGGNYLNQAKGFEALRATVWGKGTLADPGKLDTIVAVNFRMDTSAYYADIVLPAASFYEKWDLNSTDLHSFIHPFTPVIPPQFESKTDWQIWKELAAALQATGYVYDDNFHGITIHRDFSTLLNDFQTKNTGGANLDLDRDAAQFILDNSDETRVLTDPTKHLTVQNPVDPHVAYDPLNPNNPPGSVPDTDANSIIIHPRRFFQTSEAWTSEILPGEAYYGFQRMFDLKRPLNTLTGRQQFYIDHAWFQELGEELPTYKPPVDADLYPLRWITPHGRWSIHSTWRDAKYQLRMQRGRPIVYLSPNEATARGLVDNDIIKIENSHGFFIANLNISSRLPDGMAQMYHGSEKYTFRGTGGWQSPTTIRINPTQLVGLYGQLTFRLNYWGPTANQKDTRVQISKYIP